MIGKHCVFAAAPDLLQTQPYDFFLLLGSVSLFAHAPSLQLALPSDLRIYVWFGIFWWSFLLTCLLSFLIIFSKIISYGVLHGADTVDLCAFHHHLQWVYITDERVAERVQVRRGESGRMGCVCQRGTETSWTSCICANVTEVCLIDSKSDHMSPFSCSTEPWCILIPDCITLEITALQRVIKTQNINHTT